MITRYVPEEITSEFLSSVMEDIYGTRYATNDTIVIIANEAKSVKSIYIYADKTNVPKMMSALMEENISYDVYIIDKFGYISRLGSKTSERISTDKAVSWFDMLQLRGYTIILKITPRKEE